MPTLNPELLYEYGLPPVFKVAVILLLTPPAFILNPFKGAATVMLAMSISGTETRIASSCALPKHIFDVFMSASFHNNYVCGG
jgi:hypothetical protein